MEVEQQLKEKMIITLEDFAIANGWSASMYHIVENDIGNNVFHTITDLNIYIRKG